MSTQQNQHSTINDTTLCGLREIARGDLKLENITITKSATRPPNTLPPTLTTPRQCAIQKKEHVLKGKHQVDKSGKI
jgi:hypothetical protein